MTLSLVHNDLPDIIEPFPPHGFVKLTKWTGADIDVVNAARVSFHKEVDEISASDRGLLNFLLKNHHGTPFEQGFMAQFHIRIPIFVMREWVRHRIGHSVNEESGRYVEMRPDFFMPDHFRTQVGKPGSYSYERLDPDDWRAQKAALIIEKTSEDCYKAYQTMLADGIAKEQARIVLPLNLYTEVRWTCNARSLMNFLTLRNAKDAMYEIRAFADALEVYFSRCMPHTYEAFVAADRVAP